MNQRALTSIRIGTGGWTYAPWRGPFYPAGLPHAQELAHASRHLTSIEVNGTYYRAQKPETYAKWYDETPDDFVFSLKGPRFTTARRVLAEGGASIDRFLNSGISRLKQKLGPINWQFAPTKSFDPDDFAAFLRLLPESVDGVDLRHAVEVRHPSFRTPDFVALTRDRGVAIVIAGDSDYPQIGDLTAPFVYVRIMGTVETEALGYTDEALSCWAARARAWASGGVPAGIETIVPAGPDQRRRDVFLYVISGFKQRNPAAAMALIERTA